jgi:hypothetical protein
VNGRRQAVAGSAAAALVALSAVAAPVRVAAQILEGARLESRAAADPAPLVAGLGAHEPEWIAWRVPGWNSVAGLCCFDGSFSARTCNLVGREGGWGNSSDLRFQGGSTLTVLAEVERGRVTRFRPVGPNCTVAGGGRRVVELTGVDPQRSVDFLLQLALASEANAGSERRGHRGGWGEDRLRDDALGTLAFHRDSTPALVRLLRGARTNALRRQALFWLGQSEDPAALAELVKILDRR